MDAPSSGSYSPPPPPTDGGGAPPPPPASSELIRPSQPAKDPTLILLLNLILVGYFIVGQWQKGLAAVGTFLVVTVATCGTLFFIVPVFAAIDGYMQAQQLQAG